MYFQFYYRAAGLRLFRAGCVSVANDVVLCNVALKSSTKYQVYIKYLFYFTLYLLLILI